MMKEQASAITLREYAESDFEGLKKLISELQNSLRKLEPEIISSGERVGDSYSRYLLARVRNQRGRIFIAEASGAAVGVLVCFVAKEPDEDIENLYISDLSVTRSFRNKGIGARLLGQAEKYAKELDLHYLKINSLVRNEGAARLYRRSGFKDSAIVLQKKLTTIDNFDKIRRSSPVR